MRTISTLEPTRYEITASHADGRTFLVAYAAGSPSFRRLANIMWERSDAIARTTSVPDDAGFSYGSRPRPWAKTDAAGGWTFAYTGRTQRDVRNTGVAHPSIAA